MMMILLASIVLRHVHSLSASPTAKLSRASLGVESPASSAAWLTDQFALQKASEEETSVVFDDDFRMIFEQGSGPTGSGLLGIESTVGELIPDETREEVYAASLIPDEAPENVYTAKFCEKIDPSSGLPIFGVVEDEHRPKIILCVSDLDASVEFYTRCLGMNLELKRSMVPAVPAMTAIVAFSPEQPRIELRYLYGNDDVHPDVTLNVQLRDCEQIAATAQLYGGSLQDEQDDGQLVVQDPDGYTISLSELQ